MKPQVAALPLLLLLLGAFALSNAQLQNPTGTFTADNGNYVLTWAVDNNAGTITLEMRAQTTGWVGVGFSNNPSGHQQTDSVVGWVNDADNSVTLIDGISNQLSQPLTDATQSYTVLSSSQANGETVLTVQRALTTGDADDVDILNAPMTVAWGYGTNDGDPVALTYAQHSSRGRNDALNLLEVAAPPPPGAAPANAAANAFTADNGNYNLVWTIDASAGIITFQMSAATTGWVGVGFSSTGSGHSLTDSVVGWVDANGVLTLIDGFSSARRQPTEDRLTNVVPISGVEQNGVTTISFSRALDTGDDRDNEILNDLTTVAWAYGTDDGNLAARTYAQHASRGVVQQNLGRFQPTETLVADNGNWQASYLVDMASATIDIELSAATLGWVGFAITDQISGHDQSDSFVVWVELNGRVRVFDQYSTDRSQPPVDTTMTPIGSSDVTVLNGFEVDGRTVVTVRRPLRSRDVNNDVDVTNAIQTIAWAYGDNDGVVDQITGLPTYAIHTSRGTLPANLLVDAVVPQTLSFTSPNGDYRLQWSTDMSDASGGRIFFEMEADTSGWVGVGFSNSGSGHAQTDSFVAWVPDDITQPARLFDQFSVQRSQPIDDAKQNGVLTSAIERNGVTTVNFNRPLASVGGMFDVSIVPGAMTLAWAYGTADGAVVNLNEPVYAQHSARGGASVDFLDGIVGPATGAAGANRQTQGSFTSPDGIYRLTWTVPASRDVIRFDMEADTAGWIGVGWATTNGGHASTDSIVGWVDNNGALTMIDGFSTARTTPQTDQQMDINLISSNEVNGVTSISFMRPLATGDNNADVDIIDGNLFLSWAYGDADGQGPTNYPQHSVASRGTVQVNFLQDGVANGAGYGFITDAGLGLTATVVVVLGIFALIHLTHWAIKGCGERRRRKNAPTPFGAEFGEFMEPALAVAPKPANAAGYNRFSTPPSAESAGQQKTVPSGIDNSSALEFQFQQKLYDNTNDASNNVSNTPPFNNVVPTNSFYQGSQAVPYVSTDNSPVEVKIVNAKSRSGPLVNSTKRFLRTRIIGSQIKLKDALIFLVYVVVNVGWAYIWPAPGWQESISVGFLASANALWVAVPATRNSASTWLLGIPFERAVQFHRWIGRWLFVVATGHGLYYVIPGLGDIGETLYDAKNMTGFIAWALLLFITLTSIEPIRRRLFNVFFYSHAAFVAFYVFLYMHSVPSRSYIWAAAGVYLADRIARVFKGALIPQRALEAAALAGGTLRLRFRKNRWSKYRAGQYVFINFPGVALLEWHPFTLSSGPHQDYLEVHVKSLGNHTRKLHQIINGSLGVIPPLMRIDGPYGRLPMRYKRYSQLVLVGGGVGVTPLVSILKDVYQLDMSAEAKTRHPLSTILKQVYLVWVVPTETEWSWFADTIRQAKALADLKRPNAGSSFPQLNVFGHISQQGSTSDPTLICGRPNLADVFSRVQDDANARQNAAVNDGGFTQVGNAAARVAVYACGPRPLVNNAWDTSRRCTRGRARFDFHHEVFDF